jgi:hypothetical protein
MRIRRHPITRGAAATLLWSSACLLAACGRTGLTAEGDFEDDTVEIAALPEASIEASVDAGADVVEDHAVAPTPPTVGSATGVCHPAPEVCNGVDDDCNGKVDDGLATIPCPGGGSRYCVAGRWSACPERCDVCVPGSQRVCFLSYCLYWGVQTCAADGKDFGPCREQKPPFACNGVAEDHKDSPELERCCIDNGYCCADEHDLDGDGDRSEFLGRCDEVLCRP